MLHLREVRQGKNISVAELNRLSGVPVRTIEDLERRGDGRISTLWKLSQALDVPLGALYDGSEDPDEE